MRTSLAGVALFLFLALSATVSKTAAACAGCRNPNLPITRLTAAQIAPGQVRASVLVSATALNVVHEAGCADPNNCSEVPAQPRFLHDQDIYPGELRAVVELGLSRHFGIETQLPFRAIRTTIRYTDLNGAPYQPLDPDVHHRNETLTGFADPWLLGRWGDVFAGTAISARAGVSLPLGSTEENPFTRGTQGLRHQHIQFGNGTFDPLLMLDVSRTVGLVDISAYGQAQLTLYQNGKGFRGGNRFFTGAQTGLLLLAKVTAALGLDVLSERPERWDGKVEQDGNLGRTELLAALTLTRPFGKAVASLAARLPLYRHIVPGDEPQGSLSSPLMLSLSVSRTFGHGAS